MNIKSLLLGSAAALAAVTGAQAADAIVAAEPEPMEYVRVCDAFGTGYFYIPGTETCLKIGGYVRFQTDIGTTSGAANSGSSDWDSFTRAQLQFTAKSDTELGALTSVIALRGVADNGSTTAARSEFVDAAYIELAGFRVGFQYNYWDDGLSGESDVLASNATNMNSIRYTYDAGSFAASISVDELEGKNRVAFFNESDNNFGVSGQLSGKLGGFTYALLGGYDADLEEGAVRGIATVAIGPGTLGLSGVYATGRNYYYEESEWAVAAEYALKATDKLTITPGGQYFGNFGQVGTDFGGDDAYRVGLTVDYKITENLTTKLSAQYQKVDGGDDTTFGFVRLQRSF